MATWVPVIVGSPTSLSGMTRPWWATRYEDITDATMGRYGRPNLRERVPHR